MIAVSYSRIIDFEKCPRYFQHKYILKSFKEDSAAMSSGLQQHKQIENFILGRAALPKPLTHLAGLIADLKQAHEWVEPEMALAVDINWQPRGWKDWDNVYIRSKLDLVGQPREGELSIFDWKTGKVSEQRDQMRLGAAVAVATFPGTKLIHAAYVWTQHKQSDLFTISQDEVASIREHFDERADEIQAANDSSNWRPTPSGFCTRCPVSERQCEFKRRRIRR